MRGTGCFPDYFVKMTEIRDWSGELEEVMRSLSTYYERQQTLIDSIRDALTWPLILLAMLFAVLAVLMSQVMPVFEQLGMEITGVTSVAFRRGGMMQQISAVVLVLFVAVIILILVSLKNTSLRSSVMAVLNHLPLMRTVNELLTCSRFSHTLSLAFHSGLDMGEGFSLAADLVDDPTDKRKTAKSLFTDR